MCSLQFKKSFFSSLQSVCVIFILLLCNQKQGILKGGSITVPLTSCLTALDKSVLQRNTKIASCYTADSKPVKKEVNGTVILPPLVFPVLV